MAQKNRKLSFRASINNPDLIDQLNALAIETEQRSVNAMVERFLLEGIKREQAKMKPRTEKPITYIDTLLSYFYDAYEDSRGVEYINQFSGKDRGAMGRLLQIHKDKHPNHSGEDTKAGFKASFRACMEIKDAWWYQNMSVPMILSKPNVINSLLLNNGKPRQITSSDIDKIVDNA